MQSVAAPAWRSAHLTQTPAAPIDLDVADQLTIRRTLARHAFALDQWDLVALRGVLTEDASWTVTIAGEPE